MNDESGSFNIENDSPLNNSIKSNNQNYNENNEENLISNNDNYVEFNLKNTNERVSLNTLSDDIINSNNEKENNEIKYEKNKDFPTPKGFNREMNFYNNNNNDDNNINTKQNEEDENDKKLNIEDLKPKEKDLNEKIKEPFDTFLKERNTYKKKNKNKNNKKVNINDEKNEINNSNNSNKSKVNNNITNEYNNKKDNQFQIHLDVSNKRKNDFTLGKMNDELLFEKNKKKFLEEENENIKPTKFKNSFLIVQPKNGPIITELDYTRNNLKNTKLKKNKKPKKNYKEIPLLLKQNKNKTKSKLNKYSFENLLDNNSNDSENKWKNNFENILFNKQNQLNNSKISHSMNIRNINFSSIQNLSRRKNLINYEPFKNENSYIITKRKYYPNNFDFEEYQKTHSLNSIQPSNTFQNILTFRNNHSFNLNYFN